MHVSPLMGKALSLFPRNKIKVKLLRTTVDGFDYLDYQITPQGIVYTVLPSRIPTIACLRYTASQRTPIKLGKLLKMVDPLWSDNDIRNFVEQLRLKILPKYHIEIISGEAIRDAYKYNNYNQEGEAGSNLYTSCMNGAGKQYEFDYYVYNKNIRMVVLKDPKICARAYLFEALSSPKGKVFTSIMGRVYYSHLRYKQALYDWGANHTEFLMERAQTRSWKSQVWTDQKWYIPMEHWDLNYYPYLDHFKYICKKTGIWTNDKYFSDDRIEGGESIRIDNGNAIKLSRPDPFRPNQTYLLNKGKWEPSENVIECDGVYVLKKDIILCEVASCQRPTHSDKIIMIADRRRVCKNHTFLTGRDWNYYLNEEWNKCVSCEYAASSAKSKYCRNHVPLADTASSTTSTISFR